LSRRIGFRAGDTLVVASHNPHKIAEIEALLAPRGLRVRSAATLGLDEPEETGETFDENARLKATAAARVSGLPALADDSGLLVDALGGAPGVQSARWAGPAGDFAAAMRAIEERLAAAGAATAAQRRARFVAVLCLARPDGEADLYRGEVAGRLVWPPRGTNGFGYDPIFAPDGHARTFAEMTPAEKGALSHRARAFAAFAEAVLGQP
jgi:XTP/dITP diphosphohydrolase